VTEGPKTTPIYVGSKVAGHVVGGTLKKTIDGSKHMIKKPPAIAFDRAVINRAQTLGATHVEVYDFESRTTYYAEMSTLKGHGIDIDRGYGKQIALTLDYWGVNGQPSVREQQQQKIEEPKVEQSPQLSLF
jgi:hypothetical protein